MSLTEKQKQNVNVIYYLIKRNTTDQSKANINVLPKVKCKSRDMYVTLLEVECNFIGS